MKSQTSSRLKENPHSIDIVSLLGECLDKALKVKDPLKDSSVCELLSTLFNVLTECVIGPCPGNQRILIENNKVITVVNRVFSMNQLFAQSRDPPPTADKSMKVSKAALMREAAIVHTVDLSS